jgi:hypothetical protein
MSETNSGGEQELLLLEPCPFCGSSATAMKDERHWWIECDTCGASTPTEIFTQHTMQTNPDGLWNSRIRSHLSLQTDRFAEGLEAAAELVRDKAQRLSDMSDKSLAAGQKGAAARQEGSALELWCAETEIRRLVPSPTQGAEDAQGENK